MDFIGAARPSIADPYLPEKIRKGREDEIRECIGCNICYASDSLSVPIRCTQNPTIGEEWRRGWHPEIIEPKTTHASVLIVGAGPAGLEAAAALGSRGYQVKLAEKSRQAGGRVSLESTLPGLSEWSRVRDYRLQKISKMANVELYLQSKLNLDDIVEINPDHIVIATGAKWRKDGFGRDQFKPIEYLGPPAQRFTPEDIYMNRLPKGRTVIYDSDGYYLASALAEYLVQAIPELVFVTPDDRVSSWSSNTYEQYSVQRRLMRKGLTLRTAQLLASYDGNQVELRCKYTGTKSTVAADSLLLVTARQPSDRLYDDLTGYLQKNLTGKRFGVTKIGDCDAPGIIAEAVFAGHKFAREFDVKPDQVKPMKVDKVFFDRNELYAEMN